VLDPYIRLALSLVTATALWSPTLAGLFRGDVDPLSASLRFAAAFALTWAAVVGFVRMVGGYARAHRVPAGRRAGDAADPAIAPGRADGPPQRPSGTRVDGSEATRRAAQLRNLLHLLEELLDLRSAEPR